ncbi:hypothetical protein MJ1_0234 [Nanobdella aerobiophila]|uniref:Uncharacterized protein n=1 Tax=Nanobdella aerobiophila TaxID=2586965 RepID=A0A915SF15_9ARCH|nr:hypothetical protein [Nanobdella aerobiophila]BBL45405.1 hypothetical protein MJ1_0234 [Nanobdella aerobiophila]
MKKDKIISMIIFIAFLIFIIYILYKSYYNHKNIYYYNKDNITIASPYSIDQLSNINIYPNISIYSIINNKSIYLLLFNPNLTGYYNAELLYIDLKIPNIIPTCFGYSNGCTFFLENNSIENNTILLYQYYNNQYKYYYIPLNDTLLIYLVPTNKSYGIYLYPENNTILLENNNSIIGEEIAAKFVLYWYGFINN